MEETQENLSDLENHLNDVKSDIENVASSEIEKKTSFDEKIKKYKEVIPLLKNESKRKESKLNQINQKISTKTKISKSKEQEEEIEKLNQFESTLIKKVFDENKKLKTAGKDSDQLAALESEAARLKSDNLMLQKVLKETKVAADQSEDESDNENFDDSDNNGLDGPQNILKYTSLVDVANKVMKGFYEGSELTQARNFYKEIIGDEGKYKLDQKITETFVHDTIRKLKNYETEYQAKLSDFINESTDVELKNQLLKSDHQVFENDLYIETAKNKANSGEFVGGGDFFVSFCDVMSVLLCFFVVFFAISDQSAESFDEFFATWPYKNKNKNIVRPSNVSLSGEELKIIGRVKELVELGISPEAITRNDTKTIELKESNTNLFVPGKINISSSGSSILKKKLKNILSKGGIRQIKVEGHTDDEEFNRYPKLKNKYSNNLAFSIARASVVAQIINKSFKFPENLTIITGYGSKQPVKSNSDNKINSRIEIKVLQDKNIKDSSS